MLAGCGREDVRVYQAPKDLPAGHPPMSAGGSGAGGILQAPPSGLPRVQWDLPAGWKELPAEQMRVGYFSIAGTNDSKAEVTIIPLAGLAGTDLENVNRWRGQIGSGPLSAEELAKVAVAVPVGEGEGQLFDLEGGADQTPRLRMLAAILRRDGKAWFFKMTGEDALVSSQKEAFTGFLKTLRFEAAGAPATAAAAATPAPAAVAAPAEAAAASPDRPAFTVPANWKEQAPGNMQAARFVPEGADGKADVSLAILPGDGGGRLANVNRWRRQLGLPPVAESELAAALRPLQVEGAESYLVEIANPGDGRSMVAAAVLRQGRSWFYKLTGTTDVVDREKSAFVKFVESARYAP